jgi:endonuclease YncB( thermonuclease family)
MALAATLMLTKAFAAEDINKFINLENDIPKTVTVTHIFDGDTIKIQDESGIIDTVRFLGIDAPELENPPKILSDQPYAQEAKQFTSQLQNKIILLFISKVEGEQRDNHHRLLGIIVYNDEVFNVRLLKNGLAARYLLNENALLDGKYPAWEEKEIAARKEKLKIWEYIGSRGVMINELNPNPDFVKDAEGEFIEIYNANFLPVDISGWVLGCPYRTKPKVTIPEGTIIPRRGYLIFARADEMLFRQIYPSTPDSAVVIELSFVLANDFDPPEGCIVYLKDAQGAYQDAVTYNLKWDGKGADGTDKTSERVSYCVINVGDSKIGGLDDENWNPSLNLFGTPGAYNSVVNDKNPYDVNEDGQVDILDLILVGRHFGETIEECIHPNPDVNDDGVVDIFDLVLLEQHFGNVSYDK